jgi:hypothetical protein
VSRLSGADDEEVRGDPGVGDLGVGGGGLFIGVRLGDRLNDQVSGKDRAQPPGEGTARVGDRERLMPVGRRYAPWACYAALNAASALASRKCGSLAP